LAAHNALVKISKYAMQRAYFDVTSRPYKKPPNIGGFFKTSQTAKQRYG
jgi:hypothetical protein